MFTCPNCHTGLVRRQGPLGIYWSCDRCSGRAIGVGLLRRSIDERIVTRVWAAALNAPVSNGRPCPVCSRSMKEVAIDVADRPMVLDVCQRCEFIWFDGAEFEAMPGPAPKPHVVGDVDESKYTPEQRQALAMQKVEEMRASAATEPDRDWKTIPALLGLPVEMDGASYARRPWATWLLAALIVAASLAAFTNLRYAVDTYGLIPDQAWRYGGLTFLTSFFLHAGVWHLVGNMYFLIIFGCHVEDFLGRWRWLLLVALAALVGDFAEILVDPRQDLPTIGASGGISGLIAFYALKFPHAQLGILFRYGLVYFRWIRLPAWGAFVLWILFQLLGAWEQMHRIGNVASLAHLGGVVIGVACWAAWRNIDRMPAPGALPVTIR